MGLPIDANPRAGGFSVGGSTVGLMGGRSLEGGLRLGGTRASSRAQGPGQVPRLAPRQGMKRRRRGQRGKGEDSDAYKCKKYGKNDQILTCILETNRPRDSRVVSFDFKSNFMLEYVFF